MGSTYLQEEAGGTQFWHRHRMLGALAPRAHSLIVFGALFCTLAVKLYVALRTGRVGEYFSWIATDAAVLLAIELVLAYVCILWRRRLVTRICLLIAAVVCTWSVMNAGWLIATGTQILPAVLLPLIRDPLNTLSIVAVNLFYRPVAAVVLLGPSALALAFFFTVLARPVPTKLNRVHLQHRAIVCAVFIMGALLVHNSAAKNESGSVSSQGLRYNCQLKAVKTFFSSGSTNRPRFDLSVASRKVPRFDEVQTTRPAASTSGIYNVVLVVLEGIQYKQTSLYGQNETLTPYLASLAAQGAALTNARCPVTHTTKSLFSILTGRFPSVSQDIVEAVPAEKPYASLATILKSKLGFRTAFFQSAKGNFECRPGLVSNLGFEKFWARDDLGSEEDYVGYLGSDEFAMLPLIAEWIKSADKPFFLTVLCSVTHDPYKVPDWFGPVAAEPMDRYRQAIAYTDKFVAALDDELAKLNLTEKTILCVIGDHGEAFGEHGLFGHARIAFEEVLKIFWLMRAPGLIKPGLKISLTSSAVDFTPTLLALLGLQDQELDLDGINVLGPAEPHAGRKVYFSCWIQNGPCGFVQDGRKVIYDPINELVFEYDLGEDPNESARQEPASEQAKQIIGEITAWRQGTVLEGSQEGPGKRRIFDHWLCSWNNRKAWAKYSPNAQAKN